MACEIPEDLERPWFLSDIVLFAEGHELYGNRALLSFASPVFRTMLSSSFEESKKSHIDISSDYEALKKLLNIVHHPSSDSPVAELDEESLFSVYLEADKWDFRIVRKKVLQMAESHNGLHERILETFGRKEKNVACTIPESFAKSWPFSDAEVVSRDGKRFHVSKVLLSLDSFFRNQFFAEKKSSIEISINSNVLQEILHRMHHIYCECSHKIKKQEFLVQLHLAASWLEIPRMDTTPLPPMDAFIKLLDQETESFIWKEQRKPVISLCQKLKRSELSSFISSEDPRPFFSKGDLATMCKITPKGEKRRKVMDLEEKTAIHAVPVNFEKPSGIFNLMIQAKNSRGRQLYAKKEVLIKYSEFFKKMFQEPDWSEGKTPEGNDIITVDEEHIVLHRIIAVVHGCRNVISDGISAPFIHAIFQLASEEKLDIPLVRKLCLDAGVKSNSLKITCPSYLELFILLKRDHEITFVLEKMRDRDLIRWLDDSAEIYSYVSNEKEIVFDVNSEELVFSAKQAKIILANLWRNNRLPEL